MVFFWRKDETEKEAEKGKREAIIRLINEGKKDKAIKILERFKEREELRKLLFELYLEKGKYENAYKLLKDFGEDIASVEERALVYDRVGKGREAVDLYLKTGKFENIMRAGEILEREGIYEEALRVYERALNMVDAFGRREVEDKIRNIRKKLSPEEKKESLLEKFRRGLSKTKEKVQLGLLFRGRNLDEELFEEMEEMFIKADIGVKMSVKLVEFLRREAVKRNLRTSDQLKDIVKERLLEILKGCESAIKLGENPPSVILFLGVNGSGKTTTIGKLAYLYRSEGKRVLLCAADTFRAAAIEQLEIWAQRSGADIVKKQEGSDPASVVYEGLEKAKREGYDIVLVDTAGRLHTKEPLINELRKIKRIIQKLLPDEPSETLLVIDATAGQNAISQAKIFKEAVDVTGIVVTKLDGSAKGGAVIPICNELKVPIKLIGVGEKIEDLQPFNAELFVSALIE